MGRPPCGRLAVARARWIGKVANRDFSHFCHGWPLPLDEVGTRVGALLAARGGVVVPHRNRRGIRQLNRLAIASMMPRSKCAKGTGSGRPSSPTWGRCFGTRRCRSRRCDGSCDRQRRSPAGPSRWCRFPWETWRFRGYLQPDGVQRVGSQGLGNIFERIQPILLQIPHIPIGAVDVVVRQDCQCLLLSDAHPIDHGKDRLAVDLNGWGKPDELSHQPRFHVAGADD